MTHIFSGKNKELAKVLFEVSRPQFESIIKNKKFNADL
jgi:hypothetical protein